MHNFSTSWNEGISFAFHLFILINPGVAGHFYWGQAHPEIISSSDTKRQETISDIKLLLGPNCMQCCIKPTHFIQSDETLTSLIQLFQRLVVHKCVPQTYLLLSIMAGYPSFLCQQIIVWTEKQNTQRHLEIVAKDKPKISSPYSGW